MLWWSDSKTSKPVYQKPSSLSLRSSLFLTLPSTPPPTPRPALWVPATVVNGLFVPLHFRVPFITLCGCLWTSYLSLDKGIPATDSEPSPRVAMKIRKRTAEEIKSIEHGLDLIDNVEPPLQFKVRRLEQRTAGAKRQQSDSKSNIPPTNITINLLLVPRPNPISDSLRSSQIRLPSMQVNEPHNSISTIATSVDQQE